MTEPVGNPFQIVNPGLPSAGSGTASGSSARERVEQMVAGAPAFLFMKGSPSAPRCGFSANAVAMLDAHGLVFSSFDVLSDESIRGAAKEHGQWPTFPQLWVRGELVGGHDILLEMHQSGELAELARGLAR